VFKSRRIRQARHVEHTGQKTYAFRTFVGQLEGKRLLGKQTDTTIVYLTAIRLKGMDWTNLAQERDK
jgi:hypothetical protein